MIMKHNFIYSLFIILSLICLALYPNGAAFNGQGDRTGSPIANGTCGSIGCHSGGKFNPVTTIQLLDTANNPITNYKPGDSYTFKIMVTGTGSKQYGFQATALTDTNTNSGLFSGLPATVRSVNVNGHNVVEQKVPSTPGVWSFKWTAPVIGSGPVNFYACGLATNQNGNNSGDQADTTYLKLDELTAVLGIDKSAFDFDLFNRDNQQLELRFKSDKSINIKAELINYLGQSIVNQNLKIDSGISMHTIDIKKLQRGICFIYLSYNNHSVVKKFLKY